MTAVSSDHPVSFRQEAPLPRTDRMFRLLHLLRSYGSAWLGTIVAGLERCALPASPPPPSTGAEGGGAEGGGAEGMVFVPTAALLNHSCVPNCVVSFEGEEDSGQWQGWACPSLLLLRAVEAEDELLIACGAPRPDLPLISIIST